MTSRAIPLARDALPFQSDLDQVLAEPPPRFLRATTWLVASLLGTILLIASLTTTDVVVTGRGQLHADTPTIVLQPMERALIRTLAVRAGDHVRKGQLVATLDPTFAQADLNTVKLQAREAEAKITRLEAELSPWPPDGLGVGNAEDAVEARLFLRRREEYRQRLASFDDALARDVASLDSARKAAESAGRQLGIAADVADMRAALLQSAAGSKLQYLDAEGRRVQAEAGLRAARGQIAELTHAIDAARADRAAFAAQWQRTDLDDLITARAEQARLRESLAKATRLHELIELRAPADGMVLDVAARSAGSVLHEAEPLATILPTGAALVADVDIASADIGAIAEGQKVLLKVDAFPYQRHGMAAGVVRAVAEESAEAQPGAAALHRVRVALTRADLHAMPKGATLFPGMTVTAEVNVGARNVMAYFLMPVTRGFEEGLREP